MFYLIKFMRIFKGLRFYSRNAIMSFIKNYQLNIIQKMIVEDPEAANSTLEDLTKNEMILFISFLIRMIE